MAKAEKGHGNGVLVTNLWWSQFFTRCN